jgi:hypothetical protein
MKLKSIGLNITDQIRLRSGNKSMTGFTSMSYPLSITRLGSMAGEQSRAKSGIRSRDRFEMKLKSVRQKVRDLCWMQMHDIGADQLTSQINNQIWDQVFVVVDIRVTGLVTGPIVRKFWNET